MAVGRVNVRNRLKFREYTTGKHFQVINKGAIWSISVVVMYSERNAMQKQVPYSQKLWHTS